MPSPSEAGNSLLRSRLMRWASIVGGVASVMFLVGRFIPGETMIGPLLKIAGVMLFALVVCPLAMIAYFTSMLSGNRATQAASTGERDGLLNWRPTEGKALLIIARRGFIGKALGMNVRLDGHEIAQIKAPQFTAVAIEPGEHILDLGLSGPAQTQNQPARELFTATAGETVILMVQMLTGTVKSRFGIRRLPANDETRALLLKMPMILSSD